MKFLQKLGKALMLPVACLPLCGLLMGIGYLLCPATMQGGNIEGFVPLLGLFLVKAGGALIDNMALLFVIGVGVGMSDDNDGTGGLAALASWLMMTTLLSTAFVTTLMPSIADSANKTLAFDKIANGRKLYLYNMFISRKEIFDEYYKWLFDILFELEKRVNISNYTDYDKRIFGFLSERLLSVWLEKNNHLKIKEMPVYNTEQKVLPQIAIRTIQKVLVR